jgi:hypothetical protein
MCAGDKAMSKKKEFKAWKKARLEDERRLKNIIEYRTEVVLS